MARMNFKAFLLTFAAGAAFSLTVPGTVFAKNDPALSSGPELYFYPAKAWNVNPSPLTPAGTSGQSCTISNEFNNGFQMELSGSAAGIKTLTVNFIQPAFEAGQIYDVSLSVPGAINKQLNGQTPRTEILTVNMEGHTDLYNAVRSASVLDLKLMDNVFRFYMTGFADSLKRFDKCNGVAAPAVPAPAPIKEAAAEQIQQASPQQPEPVQTAEIETPIMGNKDNNAEKIVIDLTKPPPFDPNASFEDLPVPDKAAIKSETVVSPRVTSHNISEDVYEMPFEAQEMEAGITGSKDTGQSNTTKISPDERTATQIRETENPVADSKISASEQPTDAAGISGVTSNALDKKPSPGGYKRLSERLAEEMDSLAPPVQPSSPVAAAAATALSAASKTPAAKAGDGIEITYLPDSEPASTPVPGIQKEDVAAKSKEATAETIEFNQPENERQTAKSKKIETPEMKISRAQIKMDADITKLGNVEPASNKDAPFQPTSPSQSFADTSMRDKIAEMEKMIRELNEENSKLEGELKHALNESKQEQASVSSENWNLERAAMRYNEAERQIERLGQQLQRERATCQQESSKLENMLFDPELTNEKQMERLVALEREIEAAKTQQEEQRNQYEARIRALQEQARPQ